jgi:hypothetical protein
VVAAVLFQMALAVRWIAAPEVLFTQLSGPRDSLFPPEVQEWLPSFYTWDFVSYLYNPVNLFACATIALVVACGARARRLSDVAIRKCGA